MRTVLWLLLALLFGFAAPAMAAAPNYEVRFIMLKDRQAAEEIIQQLDHGADFSKLAKKKSLDRSTGERGGRMDMGDGSSVNRVFADAVRALEKHKYTKKPVETDYGWVVILLDSIRIPGQDSDGVALQEMIAYHASVEAYYRYDCVALSSPLTLNPVTDGRAFEVQFQIWDACFKAASAKYNEGSQNYRVASIPPEIWTDFSPSQQRELIARRDSVMRQTLVKANADALRVKTTIDDFNTRMNARPGVNKHD